MELRQALKEQYHAGLAMLAECVAKCPDELWVEVVPPREPWRAFWRIAFHTAFFTQLYLGQSMEDFAPWPGRKEGISHKLWSEKGELEPYELPLDAEIYSQAEILEYIGFVDGLVDATVDGLDLSSPETGFPWYENMSKISHQLMNLRHIQGHVGQLSELLMMKGIDTGWVGGI